MQKTPKRRQRRPPVWSRWYCTVFDEVEPRPVTSVCSSSRLSAQPSVRAASRCHRSTWSQFSTTPVLAPNRLAKQNHYTTQYFWLWLLWELATTKGLLYDIQELIALCFGQVTHGNMQLELSNDIQYAYRSPCYGEIAVSYRPRAVVSLKIFVYAYSWMSQYRVSLERDSAAMSTIKILLVLFNVSIINMHKLMEAIIPIVWFVAVAMASVKLRQWIH